VPSKPFSRQWPLVQKSWDSLQIYTTLALPQYLSGFRCTIIHNSPIEDPEPSPIEKHILKFNCAFGMMELDNGIQNKFAEFVFGIECNFLPTSCLALRPYETGGFLNCNLFP
jgi:hypothetical protein